jgi:hypothetical protein
LLKSFSYLREANWKAVTASRRPASVGAKETTNMNSDVTVRRDGVCFGDRLRVTFERTLRIPDDGRAYPLPPSFGSFPVRRVDDYSERVPAEWRAHGGVFLPMYQREAMWLRFQAKRATALQVAVGKVCAITGERFRNALGGSPQNYVVPPHQPWLDGICVKKGLIRQFVAMPLGTGATVEGQVTGEESVGGVQLRALPPKPGRVPESTAWFGGASGSVGACPPAMACAPAAPMRARAAGAMGLAAGGRMKQSIYADPYGSDAWDETPASRCFVHLVSSELWREITGEPPPSTPITPREYQRAGLPWFELYAEQAPALDGSSILAHVKSVKELDAEKSSLPLQDDSPLEPAPVKTIWHHVTSFVRDGNW